MERTSYMRERESLLNKHLLISAEYATDKMDVTQYRLVCVERIWRLAAMGCASDGTVPSCAIRLFDRCMGKMNPLSVCKANMLLLAIASFDICFKAIESDFKTPSMSVYYTEGFCCRYMDYNISFHLFPQRIRNAQIQVLKSVDGQPISPTAFDYLHECCQAWTSSKNKPLDRLGRRTEAAIAAYSYCLESANHSSDEITAGAVWFAIGGEKHKGWPSPDLELLCSKVSLVIRAEIATKISFSIVSLFKLGKRCMMYYYYHDVYTHYMKSQTNTNI